MIIIEDSVSVVSKSRLEVSCFNVFSDVEQVLFTQISVNLARI